MSRRLVVFSDLHGNDLALESMLRAEAEGDGAGETDFLFCGDLAGYYYGAARCARLLGGLRGLTAVRGNHDQYYLDSFADERETERLCGKYGSSYREKDRAVREYLTSLPCVARFSFAGRRCLAVHGTPDDPLEGRLYPDTELPDAPDCDLIFCGHTHYRMDRRRGGSRWINPGSLGQPRDGKGFSYCVIDKETGEAEFRTVSFDLPALERMAQERDPENRYLTEVLHRNGKRNENG